MPGWAHWGEDVNEDSLVLLVEYGDFQAVFAGDAGFPAESAMAGRLRPVDLLKVGHHGSRGSTGDAWLGRACPERSRSYRSGATTTVIPRPATLARLGPTASRCTGPIAREPSRSLTDGRRMTVRSRGESASYDVR